VIFSDSFSYSLFVCPFSGLLWQSQIDAWTLLVDHIQITYTEGQNNTTTSGCIARYLYCRYICMFRYTPHTSPTYVPFRIESAAEAAHPALGLSDSNFNAKIKKKSKSLFPCIFNALFSISSFSQLSFPEVITHYEYHRIGACARGLGANQK
jgi:hypothetical protein